MSHREQDTGVDRRPQGMCKGGTLGPRFVKYMGSKNSLLANGLGQLILEEAQRATRIVDLFCGGSSISWFAAENTNLPVLASDLQRYAVVLAGSVVERTKALDPGTVGDEWFGAVRQVRKSSRTWRAAQHANTDQGSLLELVRTSRELCRQITGTGPVWSSYGGHYFSPSQAATIDAMLEALPEREPIRTVCLAATIASGSHCAASPGHTAQPFQPTRGAARYIVEAWAKDPLTVARKALEQVCQRRANVVGGSAVGDAVSIASTLSSSDLVIVDPPYSGVQYSRFYHVLETIAMGRVQSVSGIGRYPPLESRPQSSFSNLSQSMQALNALLENLSRARTTVIFTFPAGPSSNGLSGDIVTRTSSQWFDVQERRVVGRFSTLGGNNTNRSARSESEELILLMRSKPQHQ